MTEKNYEITNPGGTTTQHDMHADLTSVGTRVVVNGRQTGTLTFTVKALDSDYWTAPTNNTLDLTTSNVWYLEGVPLTSIKIADGGSGTYKINIRQYRL